MAQAMANAENYIADYNIYMGSLRTEDGRQLWPEDKVLLSHWNLRDELKAQYAAEDGQEKQEMIYKVMQRIVNQTIPQAVINNGEYLWHPYCNQIKNQKSQITNNPEPYTRYERILEVAHAYFEEDPYCPTAPTGIIRNFEEGMEFPAAELDSLFRIRARLGRDLRPYDIWFDGFKARASMDEDALTATTRVLYPDAEAFEKDMPRLLQKMGFDAKEAQSIASHIVVEPARGSGHAWPSLGRKEEARLRTRIPASGMDYRYGL